MTAPVAFDQPSSIGVLTGVSSPVNVDCPVSQTAITSDPVAASTNHWLMVPASFVTINWFGAAVSDVRYRRHAIVPNR